MVDQIQGMNLLHKIYTVSINHMYCIVYRWSQVAIWGWSQIQGMNVLHEKYTVYRWSN